MNCISIAALSYFLTLIDPTIVETSGNSVIIKAEEQVVVYTYNKHRGVFCFDKDGVKS